MRHGLGLVVVCLILAMLSQAMAQDPASWRDAYTGDKVTIRTINGSHICTTMRDGTPCGSDHWTITEQNDGTRTIRSFHDGTVRGTQMNLVMRADEDLKPLEAFINVYSQGNFLGSGFYVMNDGKLDVTVNAPDEYFTDQVELPEHYSLLLHPISVDGWHFGRYDRAVGGAQPITLCTLGAARRSVHCGTYPLELEFVADETLTVPAGTFETEHYRFGPDTDVWITGPDGIMVQHEYRVRDSRWQLTEIKGDY